MSRIAKKPIEIPAKTEVSVASGILTVKGPLGSLSRPVRSVIDIKVADGTVTLVPTHENLETRALLGTYASHLRNMIEGVNKPYEKKLIVEGIGYKADIKGTELTLSLGFSHQIKVQIPSDLKVTSEKGVLTISGINNESVGQFASQVRSLKKPEPYKGKGIRYDKEVIRRKQGKKSV